MMVTQRHLMNSPLFWGPEAYHWIHLESDGSYISLRFISVFLSHLFPHLLHSLFTLRFSVESCVTEHCTAMSYIVILVTLFYLALLHKPVNEHIK